MSKLSEKYVPKYANSKEVSQNMQPFCSLLIAGLKSSEYDKFFKEYNYENAVIWTLL